MWGGITRDNRNFINAVFWGMCTGVPEKDSLLILEAGAIPTFALSDGAIRVCRKNSLKK